MSISIGKEYIPQGGTPEEIASRIAESFGESISAKLGKIFEESEQRMNAVQNSLKIRGTIVSI